MQDDAHSPLLTVRETLQFAAMLRMRITSPAMVEKSVQEIMRLLRIEGIAHSFIGAEDQRTISRGQLRRVTIGCEIIDSASLIFLDEVCTPCPSLFSLLASFFF
jgi:ABC-type multidrug transport system ATPase subunit